MRNSVVSEADLSYAIFMVRWSFFTPDRAARTCGIPLPTLRAALVESLAPRGASASLNTGLPA